RTRLGAGGEVRATGASRRPHAGAAGDPTRARVLTRRAGARGATGERVDLGGGETGAPLARAATDTVVGPAECRRSQPRVDRHREQRTHHPDRHAVFSSVGVAEALLLRAAATGKRSFQTCREPARVQSTRRATRRAAAGRSRASCARYAASL